MGVDTPMTCLGEGAWRSMAHTASRDSLGQQESTCTSLNEGDGQGHGCLLWSSYLTFVSPQGDMSSRRQPSNQFGVCK